MVESRVVTLFNGDAQIETPEGRTLVLGNPVFDDLRVELTGARVPAAAGPDFVKFKDDGSGSTGVYLNAFDKSTDENLYFNAQFPHGQQLDTEISPHIHWSPAANGTAGQKVNWGLEYTWVEPFGVFGDTTIIYANDQLPADSSLVAGKHYISPFPDIGGHTAEVSNLLVCRLFRDSAGNGGTDDLDNDAFAIYVDFHYQIDTLGSRTEFSK